MKVLIVDDQATNRKLLRAQLEAEGLGVLDATDGVEALAVLEREHVDAVITDILMPRMDLPPCQADPTLIEQVFANLLSNVLKYTRQRTVAEIEIGWRDDNGRRVFFVRDNGAGFDIWAEGKPGEGATFRPPNRWRPWRNWC